MNSIQTLDLIQDYHNQLDSFITSLQAVKNHNQKYQTTFKSSIGNNNFTIVQRKNENDETVKLRAEKALEQIYEFNDRNEILLQIINDFLNNINVLHHNTEVFKNHLESDRNVYQSKMNEIEDFINTKIEQMRNKELSLLDKQKRIINEKYEKEMKKTQ